MAWLLFGEGISRTGHVQEEAQDEFQVTQEAPEDEDWDALCSPEVVVLSSMKWQQIELL